MASEPLLDRVLRRTFVVEPEERAGVTWAVVSFFLVLGSCYVLRPVREAMGIAGGIKQLPWLWTATFALTLIVIPIYSALVARYPRRRFVPLTYHAFVVILVVFAALFGIAGEGAWGVWVARGFYIWFSVFNLLVVSVLWELASDLFRRDQGERLFGLIAFGGSVGAAAGPLLTSVLAEHVGTQGLCLIAAVTLEGAALGLLRLMSASERFRGGGKDGGGGEDDAEAARRPIGGSPFAGFAEVVRSRRLAGLCAYVFCLSLTSTFLYFEQAHIVDANVQGTEAQTVLFARIDTAVNVLAIVTQLFVAGRAIPRLGLGLSLAVLPVMVLIGFATLGAAPVLAVLVGFQVLRRAANYAVSKPAREVLFTLVPRSARYKAKSFIDTVVYRGSDVASGWVFDGLLVLGLGLSAIAFTMVPVAGAWIVLALVLGRRSDDAGTADDVKGNEGD